MDASVVGAGFYVMEFVKGRIFQNVRMPGIEEEERRKWCVAPDRRTTADRYLSWRSAIRALTRLSTIPLHLLDLPPSFAPTPESKPYFPRQVNSLLKVSAAQSRAKDKVTGKEVGEIWGTRELWPWFEEGAAKIARMEKEGGVDGVVHGDYKLDNMVGDVPEWG